MVSIRNTLAILLAAVVLAACGASGQSTVEQFYRNLDKGDISAAYQAISPNSRSLVPEAKVRAMLADQSRRVQQQGGLQAIEASGSEKGEIGQYTVKLRFGNKSERSEVVKVVKLDGKWYIDK